MYLRWALTNDGHCENCGKPAKHVTNKDGGWVLFEDSAQGVIERLADKYAPLGECPPEDLKPRQGCAPDADCRQCWIDTLTKFLEIP